MAISNCLFLPILKVPTAFSAWRALVKAQISNYKRVWLITTNDNAKVIRFYQKREFEQVGFYKDSMDNFRKLKPEIPKFGDDDISIKHEIEFEL